MTSRFTELVIDCRDPSRLAAFWSAVLGFQIIDQRPDLVEIASWEPTAEQVRQRQMPPSVIFKQVPESKQIKNRLHLDVSPIDRSQEEEAERLLALGARKADIGQGECNWIVLLDPEGNEFCLLRSLVPQIPNQN